MNRANLPVILAALATLVLAAFLFFNFERVETREHVGLQGEARTNPYLAAERLLARMGLTVRELKAPGDLDRLQPQAVMFAPRGRGALDVAQLQRLLRWADSGGHLIVEAELLPRTDLLLQQLGVERIEQNLEIKLKELGADRGFDSAANREWLTEEKTYNGIAPRDPRQLSKRMKSWKCSG